MKRLPVSFLDKALLNGRNIVETIIGHINLNPAVGLSHSQGTGKIFNPWL
jgi:hypothetical protein